MRFLKLTLVLAILAVIGIGTAFADNEQTEKKRHPSYVLTGRDAQPAADSPLNPNFVVSDEARMSEGKFWRSSFINESVVGLVVEDIDGNGKNEMVYASSRNVYVARMTGGKMQQLAKYTLDPTDTVVSVDAMDLTGSGRMEIIVSAQNDKQAPVSQILNFTGSDLTPAAKNIPWYLRVVGGPGGRFLAGQKGSTSKGGVYNGSVMRMKFDGSNVASQGSVGLPSGVNLFNFAIGRLGSSGSQLTVAIRFPSEHIFLYEGSNRTYETKEEYGGTMVSLRQPKGNSNDVRRREFLPSRLLIADIDRDGQNEIIVAKNDRGGIPFMSNQRGFTSGVMQVFKYANMTLTPYFRSRTLPGPAVDYALADYDNSGHLSLVVAVVTEQKSGIMQEGRSVIVAYELYPANAE